MYLKFTAIFTGETFRTYNDDTNFCSNGKILKKIDLETISICPYR